MSSIQQNLARLYIADAIKNSSASIKACWTIVFTAATIGALSPAIKTLKCSLRIIDPDTTFGAKNELLQICHDFDLGMIAATFWPFFVYLATFARFYLGGIRVFDIKYNEIFSLINNEISFLEKEVDKNNEPETVQRLQAANQRFILILRYNDTKRYKIEVFWLLLQSLVVVSLAYEIATPKMFIETYAFLLLANSAYLFWGIYNSNMAITNLEHEVFPEWSPVMCKTYEYRLQDALTGENLPHNAAMKWAINNVLHALVMFLFIGFIDDFSVNFMLLLCTTNILFDFLLTRNFYFPNFLEKYKILK